MFILAGLGAVMDIGANRRVRGMKVGALSKGSPF
jgi:hypothetical protein